MTVRRLVLALLAACVAGSAVTAVAAGLTVASSRLTSLAQASSVPATTCTLTASADAYVDQTAATSNFGSAASLTVRARNGRVARSYVSFDLSSCAGFVGSYVTSATLRAYLSVAPSSSRTYLASRAGSSWGESTITWNNQPGAGGGSSGSTGTGTANGVTLQWTMTAALQELASGTVTNNGFVVHDASEGGNQTREGNLGSRESGNGPTLAISYYP